MRRKSDTALGLVRSVVWRLRARGDESWAVEQFDRYFPHSRKPTAADRRLTASFLLPDGNDVERFELLFQYFAEGAARYGDAAGSRILYPGYAHDLGRPMSGLEGFARVAPLVAAWLHSGRTATITLADGRAFDLPRFLAQAFLAGTQEDGTGYWGDVGCDDQRIVEAADIARVVWLSREWIWDRLDGAQRLQIGDWLRASLRVELQHPNNCVLCQVTTGALLQDLGVAADFREDLYGEFKRTSFRESGWFSDGPAGPVDYYNCWGISYELFWLKTARPEFDSDFIEAALAQSAQLTAHLISPEGVPILGRSLCYRTSVPSPLVAEALRPQPSVPPGEARRALDLVWRYFVERGALRDHGLTLGYFDNDPRLVDGYSGAGSCHWGLRSLTLAFMAPPGHVFWTDAQRPVPIERGSYHLELPKLGWTIDGSHPSRDISIRVAGNGATSARLAPMDVRRRLKETLLARPFRPENPTVKYQLSRYSAATPLGGTIAPPRSSPSRGRLAGGGLRDAGEDLAPEPA